MRIVEAKGQWLVNTGAYPLMDSETGVVFQPGELTRAKLTEWVKSQPTMQKVEDPLAEPASQKPVKGQKPSE